MSLMDHKSLTELYLAVQRQNQALSEAVRRLNQNDTVATMETTLSAKDLQHFKDMAHALEEAKQSISNLEYWISEAHLYNALAACPNGSLTTIGSFWLDDALKLAIDTSEAITKER